MKLEQKKLGLLLAARPKTRNFDHALGLAEEALNRGVGVYLYCVDDAVFGISDRRLQSLKQRGLKLYACAYGARERGLTLNEQAVYCGLSMVSDLVVHTDRFLGFS